MLKRSLLAALAVVGCGGSVDPVECTHPAGVYDVEITGCGVSTAERYDWTDGVPTGCTVRRGECLADGGWRLAYQCADQPAVTLTERVVSDGVIAGELELDGEGCAYAVFETLVTE